MRQTTRQQPGFVFINTKLLLMAKAAKKTTTKRKPRPKPIKDELWVLNPDTGDVDKAFVKGDNCTGFDYNSESVTPWFKIYYGSFSVTTIGIPYSVVEPY